MTPFAYAHVKRRIASVMLVFWLFTLGAGWANACILQERSTHLHADSAAQAGASTVSAGYVGALADHGGDSPSGKAPCLKACDDSSQSLIKWSSGIALLDLSMAPPTVLAWSVSAVALDSARTGHIGHPPRAGIPLRTRYSRLTL